VGIEGELTVDSSQPTFRVESRKLERKKDSRRARGAGSAGRGELAVLAAEEE
jgi:hypothetical protein